jgi:hypothetical protein
LTNNPNITSPVVGIRNGIRVAQFAPRVLYITIRDRNAIAINSANFIPNVVGVVVDVVHAVDAVEVVSARIGVGDDPGTITDGADGGAGVRSKEVGDLARVSNVELIILTERREIR